MESGEAFQSVLMAAQNGAEWAFDKLYRSLNPRLERYLEAKAPGGGQDLAAETWIAAARSFSAFEGNESDLRSWLFTIAYRRLSDYWRMQPRIAQPVDPTTMLELEGSSDPEETVVDAISAREAAIKIVDCLSPEQADVVLLRVLGDLDVDQVAEIVGKRPGAVRALQHRALQKLKEETTLEGVTE